MNAENVKNVDNHKDSHCKLNVRNQNYGRIHGQDYVTRGKGLILGGGGVKRKRRVSLIFFLDIQHHSTGTRVDYVDTSGRDSDKIESGHHFP